MRQGVAHLDGLDLEREQLERELIARLNAPELEGAAADHHPCSPRA